MLRCTSVNRFMAILVLALSSAWANAEPTHWSYGGSADPNPVGTTDTNAGDTALGQGMWLNSVSGGPFVGSQHVRLLNLQTINDHAVRAGPDFQNVHYTVTAHLFASNQSADLTFPGVLSGAVDYQRLTSTVTSTFTGPTSQSVLLGGDRFTVTLAPFSPLQWVPFQNPPDSGLLAQGTFGGSIDAQVDVESGSVAKSPEPSTLALAGVGLGLAAAITWHKRRRMVVEKVE